MVSQSPVNDERASLPSSALPVDHLEDTSGNEEHMCMRGTIPQHIDDHFSKIQDMAGTGECDALGG